MPRLREPIRVETLFGIYELDELLGEGGAGRVYGGVDPEGNPIAWKVLASERATSDKRRRLKNEISFLSRNKHANIVPVTDHGLSSIGPFYVMPKYEGNLRSRMEAGIKPDSVLALFSQILDGVEAAHLKGVIHRDLKPENILWRGTPINLAVADFGIARFTEDLLVTVVDTDPAQRLANFQYAAPEQRSARQTATQGTDIYALGLILNEMFTGIVPHGTDYKLIGRVAQEQGFLDDIVERMLRQSLTDRPGSIAELKGMIQRYQAEAVSLQRLSAINGTVIKAIEIDEPLAERPPKLIDADWRGGQLVLILDRPVTAEWVNALHRMGSYTSVYGKPPQVFAFNGKQATVPAAEHDIPRIIEYFKLWLPAASLNLKAILEENAQKQDAARKEQLRREREAEERRLRILRNIKI